VWFLRYASRQTDRQTYKHGDRNTSHLYLWRSKYIMYVCVLKYLSSVALACVAAVTYVFSEVASMKSSSACRILVAVAAETVVSAVGHCHNQQFHHSNDICLSQEEDAILRSGPTGYEPFHQSTDNTPGMTLFLWRGRLGPDRFQVAPYKTR